MIKKITKKRIMNNIKKRIKNKIKAVKQAFFSHLQAGRRGEN
jgi:hypothetical protein